jgi:outer membrane protein OmpA-like peptidoglycan-associated protein
VSEVNDKVNSLDRSIGSVQDRTRQDETRIGQVQQQTQNAAQAAQRAAAVARQADAEAADARTKASAAGEHADRLEKMSRRLLSEVVIDDMEGNFKFGNAVLPAEAMHKIDDLVAQLERNPRDVYFEIAGYTDNVGNGAFNEQLGLERAEAAERYLHEHHQIPLHKINVISYGEENPIAPNSTGSGRAKNRRIVIKVVG